MFNLFRDASSNRAMRGSENSRAASNETVNLVAQAVADSELMGVLERGSYLDLLGRGVDVPEALRRLASKLEARAFEGIDNLVNLSMLANDSVIAAATMARQTSKATDDAQTIAAAATELTFSTREIAEQGSRVASETDEARQAADRIRDRAQQAYSGMDRIAASVDGTLHKVQELAEASDQIARIVKQIEAIAKQTNLLALNATIEAARAGEAGKGFAVVAGEVKTLSRQTAQATEDIRKHIGHLTSEIAEIVHAMETSAEAVKDGHGLIQTVAEDAAAIAGRIEEVSRGMSEVSRILDEQGSATTEVSNGIGRVADALKTNVTKTAHVLDCMDAVEKAVSQRIEVVAGQQIEAVTVIRAKADHVIWKKGLSLTVRGYKM